MPPVGAVGAAGVFGFGGFDEPADLLGQTVERRDCPALGRGNDQIVRHGALNCSAHRTAVRSAACRLRNGFGSRQLGGDATG
jgi:hypothetical protein